MTPESVGISKTKLNLTSRSGRHVIKHRMESLGYQKSDYEIETLYADFLALADKKGQVFDDDLEALLFNIQQQDQQDFYRLLTLNVQCGGSEFATSSIKLAIGDDDKIVSTTGNGPVDALYRAIKKAIDIEFEVSDYKISNKGEGEDGLGKADIVVSWQGRNFHGYGLDTDVIKASGHALVNALNGIHRAITIAELKNELKTDFKKEAAIDGQSQI
jgi:2-isopropylmalate synthase